MTTVDYKKIKYYFTLLAAAAIFLVSCEREVNDPLPEPDFFINAELVAKFSTDDIRILLNSFGDIPSELSLLLRYNVSVYKIVYNTYDTGNNPVIASGALLLPENKNPLPLMSFQHGTITSDKDAPSYFSSDIHFPTLIYASVGLIIALPDYLGYGSSGHLDHPYEHGHSMATASRDMIRAVREWDLISVEFQANDKLFLTGYSQGGYATMALLRLLEEEHATEFRVTAATAGAGAYNKSEFMRYIVGADRELRHLNTYLWVLDTYNRVYGLNRPYSYFFKEPNSTVIEAGGVFANTEMNPQNLFTDQFRDGILSKTDSEFIEIIAENDNFDWKPVTPLQLYHGTDDDFVMYFNSLNAFEAMTDRRAGSVELKTLPGKDHGTAIADYFTGTFLFFLARF